jgi:hypothetical protein
MPTGGCLTSSSYDPTAFSHPIAGGALLDLGVYLVYSPLVRCDHCLPCQGRPWSNKDLFHEGLIVFLRDFLVGNPDVIVQGYNEDDCRATERLRHWLESLRAQIISNGTEVPRPQAKDTSPSEEVTAHQQRVAALFDALTKDLPAEPSDRTAEQAARWLLAHALDWHRREEKVKWWEFFRMKDLSEEDLYDEKTAVAGLSLRQRMPSHCT